MTLRYDPDTGRYRCELVPVYPSATPVPGDHVCVLEYDIARCASYCPECGHCATDEQLERAHTQRPARELGEGGSKA